MLWLDIFLEPPLSKAAGKADLAVISKPCHRISLGCAVFKKKKGEGGTKKQTKTQQLFSYVLGGRGVNLQLS